MDPLEHYSETRAQQRLTQGAYSNYLNENSEVPLNAEYIINNDIQDIPSTATLGEDELVTDETWMAASKTVYEAFKPEKPLPDDQTYGQWGVEFMGDFNYNLTRMGLRASALEEKDDQTKWAFYHLMNEYDRLPVSWRGTQRFFKGVVQDPTTYVGLGALGVGLLGRAAVKQTTKEGMKRAITAGFSPAAIAAYEGAGYAGLDNYFRQKVAVEAEVQPEIRKGEVATAAGIGAVAAGTTGYLISRAGDVGKFFRNRAERKELSDFQAKIKAKAPIKEIEAHPALARATQRMMETPETTTMQGYGTLEFANNRQFKFGDESITGYYQAVPKLYNDALTLAYRGEGISVPDVPVENNNVAYIVTGPPAAGKSSIANKIAIDKKLAILDPDEAKAILPEYEGGVGSNAVHSESKNIIEAVEEVAFRNNANVLFPTVGHDPNKIRGKIADLKQRGYTVYLVDVTLPLEETKRRAYDRFSRTGRLVPTSYIDEVGERPSQTYLTLKEEGIADGYAQIDNSPPKGEARKIIQDSGDVIPRSIR